MTITEAETPLHHGVSHTLAVPATRGKMGRTVFYTANFPLGMVVKLFTYDPERMAALPVEQRTQRALKRSRIPDIAEYILRDDQDYFFSSLTVSVDVSELDFEQSALDENVGILRLPMETDWIINDGQHRVAGIAEALRQDPTLRADNISVVILPDEGLEHAQQVFSDLNRTVQKTSRSLDILFDKRSVLNRISNVVVNEARLFHGRTDKERMSLSPTSPAFATLAGVQSAIAALFAHVKPDDIEADYVTYEALAIEFWEFASTLVEPWTDIGNGTIRPAEARQNFVSSYQVAVSAVAAAGSAAMVSAGDEWKVKMAPLKDVDWHKTNPEWQGFVMIGTEVVTRVTTRRALADLLRFKIGVGTQPRPVLNGPAMPMKQKPTTSRSRKPKAAASAPAA